MSVAGCILAGGRSSRFGSDKALALWRGRPLLAHAIERLRPQVSGLVISANGSAPQYLEMGLPVAADGTKEYLGPLAGVLAGLRWARDGGAQYLLTAAADTPLFPLDLAAVFARTAAGGKIVAAQSATGIHPTFALWPVSFERTLAPWLASGQSRRMTDFLESQSCETAWFDRTGPFDPFFNINTPGDLAALEKS